MTALFLLSGASSAAELRAGHLIAVGRESAADTFSTVFQIDPATGATEVIFSGQQLGYFGGIVVHSRSEISFQKFGHGGKLFTVNLDSGQILEHPLSFYSQGGLRLARDGRRNLDFGRRRAVSDRGIHDRSLWRPDHREPVARIRTAAPRQREDGQTARHPS